MSNYRALRRAAPQQTFINDGDYMIDEKTQRPLGVASDLNAELDVLRQKHAKYFKEKGCRAYSDAFNHVIVNHQGQEYGFDLICAVQLLTDLNNAIQIAAKTNDRYLK